MIVMAKLNRRVRPRDFLIHLKTCFNKPNLRTSFRQLNMRRKTALSPRSVEGVSATWICRSWRATATTCTAGSSAGPLSARVCLYRQPHNPVLTFRKEMHDGRNVIAAAAMERGRRISPARIGRPDERRKEKRQSRPAFSLSSAPSSSSLLGTHTHIHSLT